ncbi:PP2C family protein-serine/threonine phosphatase [Streptomyces sp. 4N509B]|uniref:PP2C family protein-serine/threonine phosphatase n=1 Tax=Streptomyces sp. 4N509B TaxID=3457413 RepID=UPI003FD2BD34
MRHVAVHDSDELGGEQERLRELTEAKRRVEGLLGAVVAISREVELPSLLLRIVTTAMDLVGARYGALGVLDESGEQLEQFITAGLSDEERAALAGIDFPHGAGVLGEVIHAAEPMRVNDIRAHPGSVGFPPGHPSMRTLLGVAIRVRSEVYGDLYLSERHDGRPFDSEDEEVIVALAGAAGIAIENARLFARVRDSAELFQRLLLPTLPDLTPFTAAAAYQPAAEPGRLGGDWYDAILLPDDAVGIIIGDVVGHDLSAAAAMAQTRSMMRALLFERREPPSAVLARLDHTLLTITDLPVTTACLVRIESGVDGWALRWSSAGHVPPLLVTADGHAEYLTEDPGLPLGVDSSLDRPDHTHAFPPGATLVLVTDGLVENAAHASIDDGLAELAALATAHVDLPLPDLVDTLASHHPGDGHDDMAILAVRTPTTRHGGPA